LSFFAALAPSGVVPAKAVTVCTAKSVDGLKKAMETAPLIVALDLHGNITSELTLKRLVRELEYKREVLNISYLPGFAAIPPTNFAIIVTTDNNPAQVGARNWLPGFSKENTINLL
jgi:hypothetical protein